MLTSDRMAAIDRNAAALGVSQRQLMESSANAVAHEVRQLAAPGASVAIVAGRGNNGGDGFAAARFLSEYDVTVYLAGHPDRITAEPARTNWDVLKTCEIPQTYWTGGDVPASLSADVIVDGLLGTGVSGALREPIRSAVTAINASEGAVVAIDIPTGVHPDDGDVADIAVDADHVVTFHDRKPGLQAVSAEITVADIGIPRAAERFVGPGDVAAVTGRDPGAHKGDHGRILVIGGGPYTGAPALAGQAALRTGADLVEVAVPAAIADTVASYAEDLIVTSLPGDRLQPSHLEALTSSRDAADVVLLGPGLGEAETTQNAVRTIVSGLETPGVVDADALDVLPDVTVDTPLIATPHAGEFADMGFTTPADWEAAETVVREAAAEIGATVLLKGRYDVISDGSDTRVNRTGNPGMTVGGTGDVLAGACAACLARTEPLTAGSAAAWLTGTAGDELAVDTPTGFLASDVAAALPTAIATVR